MFNLIFTHIFLSGQSRGSRGWTVAQTDTRWEEKYRKQNTEYLAYLKKKHICIPFSWCTHLNQLLMTIEFTLYSESPQLSPASVLALRRPGLHVQERGLISAALQRGRGPPFDGNTMLILGSVISPRAQTDLSGRDDNKMPALPLRARLSSVIWLCLGARWGGAGEGRLQWTQAAEGKKR